VVNAYTLAFGDLLLLGGRAGPVIQPLASETRKVTMTAASAGSPMPRTT
jgi:hypothetical protein